jgi:hypothetical protein
VASELARELAVMVYSPGDVLLVLEPDGLVVLEVVVKRDLIWLIIDDERSWESECTRWQEERLRIHSGNLNLTRFNSVSFLWQDSLHGKKD